MVKGICILEGIKKMARISTSLLRRERQKAEAALSNIEHSRFAISSSHQDHIVLEINERLTRSYWLLKLRLIKPRTFLKFPAYVTVWDELVLRERNPTIRTEYEWDEKSARDFCYTVIACL
jgi:hypothetical protein